MKSLSILSTTVVLLFCCVTIQAQENPYLSMAGKNYVDYAFELFTEYYRWTYLKTNEKQKVIRQIIEVSEKTGGKEWQLYADYLTWNLQRGSIEQGFELIRKAQQASLPHIELMIRHHIIERQWSERNYELALELCELQARQLEGIVFDDIPVRAIYYNQFGNYYYDFKDYAKAIYFFEKTLSEQVTAHNQWNRQAAYNGLGLIYRYGFNDLDRSDSCFYIIRHTNYLKPDDEKNRANWDGIAEGNIGRNMVLRREYDKALPLLESSMQKMLKFDDYAYATHLAINLAIVHLNKGNPKAAKRYLDLAYAYEAKMPGSINLPLLYETLSKYYAVTGNAPLSMAYMDSTLAEKQKMEERYNAFQMMRVEQRRHLSEQQLNEQQLHAEKIRRIGYERSLLITIGGLLLIGGGFFRYLALYRKKQAAYHELALKSQEWAKAADDYILLSLFDSDKTSTNDKEKDAGKQTTKADIALFSKLQSLLQSEQLYSDADLTVDKLAHRLKVNKAYLSRAINNCSGKNFNTYINDYRIKKAVLLISDDACRLSFEGIAFEAGFNDRRSFYNAFKKITGLSPSDFRKSMQTV